VLVASALVGCNLIFGIEEQPLRPDDAGSDAPPEARGAFEGCSKDSDCLAPNACYTPHCDSVLGACTYALCEAKDRTCAVGTCDPKTFACSDPQSYGFHATTYHVTGVTLGCGPTPEACVASAFPFVFVGTADAVVALRADELLASQAARVPITNLGPRPAQLVASGRRLWVLGAVQGQTPPYQLPITAIDVPSDPTVPSLEARTRLVPYPFPTALGFAGPNGGLFIAYDEPAQGFPAVLLDALPPEGASFGLANALNMGASDAGPPSSPPIEGSMLMVRTGVMPAGARLAAASGTRLVTYRPGAVFNLITGASTPSAVLGGDLQLQAPLGAIGPARFAQGPDGVVAIGAPIAADTDCNCTTHERLQYVFPNAIATATDVNQILDPESYTNPATTPDAGAGCHQCTGDYMRLPMLAAWVDKRSMLTAAAMSGAAAARAVTDVRLLARDPLDGYAKRRFALPATDLPSGQFGVDRIGLTSSNGLGYLLVADGQGNDVTMSIFDPRCDAR
jgi:hypothetical protein